MRYPHSEARKQRIIAKRASLQQTRSGRLTKESYAAWAQWLKEEMDISVDRASQIIKHTYG